MLMNVNQRQGFTVKHFHFFNEGRNLNFKYTFNVSREE